MNHVLMIANLITEDPDIILEAAPTLPNSGEVSGDSCAGCGRGELVLRRGRGRAGFFLGCSRYTSGCDYKIEPNQEEKTFNSEIRDALKEKDFDTARTIAQEWMRENPQSEAGRKALTRVEQEQHGPGLRALKKYLTKRDSGRKEHEQIVDLALSGAFPPENIQDILTKLRRNWPDFYNRRRGELEAVMRSGAAHR